MQCALTPCVNTVRMLSMSVYLEAYSNPWALLWTISTTLRAGSGCAVGGERQVCVCVTGLRKVKVEDEGNVKLFRSSYFFSPSTIVQANVRFEQARQDQSIVLKLHKY